MDTLRLNLRYATRQLLRNPGFSAIAALTVALGIGVTTVIFSLINAVMLRPLPVHEPHRLVSIEEVRESGRPRNSMSYPRLIEYRQASARAARLGAYGLSELAFHAGAEAQVLMGAYVTGDYFDLLGIAPARGRFFTTAEELAGVPEPLAVISHALWQRQFGGDPGVIGQTIRLNSQQLTVIGVAPQGFHGLLTGVRVELWVPIPMRPALSPGSDIYTPGRFSWLVMFGRLNDDVDVRAAAAELGGVARGIAGQSERERDTAGVQVSKLSGVAAELRTPVRLFLTLLLGCAGLVLFIACVNVAGMLLARATTRGREVGIRLALGAGRRRLVGQLLTESTLLFLLGGVGGVLLAVWLADAVTAFPSALPVEISLDARPDPRVIAFGLLLSLGTGLIFGLAPAFHASSPQLVPLLKAGGGAAGGRPRLRSAFIVGQISVCLLLLATAGLLMRSLRASLAIDPGMDARGVVVAAPLNLTPHGYDEERGRIFYGRFTERVRAQPGVEAVALAHNIPLTFEQIVYGVEIPGRESPTGEDSFTIEFNVVDQDYFRTLRIPLEGRAFTAADGPDASAVVIINRTMANRFWPDGDALGRRIWIDGANIEIVGIATDGKYQSLTEDPIPYMYLPFAQRYRERMTLHVRAAGGLGAVSAMLRRELQRLDADVPLLAPALLEDHMRISLLPQRIGATLIGIFGGLGLVLAAVGLYGVLAYSVSQRTHEIGVRLALGARADEILRMVLRQGGALLLAGLGIGLILALATTHFLGALLVIIRPTDPVTLVAVSLLLAAVAILACYVPARRATRVDPMAALRTD